MCTGHAIQIPHSLLDPVRTLTATIAAELGETVQGGPHYRVLFVIGLELLGALRREPGGRPYGQGGSQ